MTKETASPNTMGDQASSTSSRCTRCKSCTSGSSTSSRCKSCTSSWTSNTSSYGYNLYLIIVVVCTIGIVCGLRVKGWTVNKEACLVNILASDQLKKYE